LLQVANLQSVLESLVAITCSSSWLA
jgi:hypothetical protein